MLTNANTLRANKNDFFAFISVDHEIKHFLNGCANLFRLRQTKRATNHKHEPKVKIAIELPSNGLDGQERCVRGMNQTNKRILNDLTDNVQVCYLAFHGVRINLALNSKRKAKKKKNKTSNVLPF